MAISKKNSKPTVSKSVKPISYLIERLNNLPPSVQAKFNKLNEYVQERKIYPIKVNELCAILGVKLTEEQKATPLDCLNLQKLLDFCSLKMIPPYVIAELKDDYIIMLAPKPQLEQDPDIQRVRELIAKKVTNLTTKDAKAIEMAKLKMAAYNVLLRVFELIPMFNCSPLLANAVSNFESLISSLLLPQDAERYLRSCLSFITAYGSYKVDFKDERFHYKSLDEQGMSLVLKYFRQIFTSVSDDNLRQNLKNTPYASVISKVIASTEDFIVPNEFNLQVQDFEAEEKISHRKKEDYLKLLKPMLASSKLEAELVTQIKERVLKKHFTAICNNDPIPQLELDLPNAKNLNLAKVYNDLEVVVCHSNLNAPYPVVKVDGHGEILELSPISKRELQGQLFAKLSLKINNNYLRQYGISQKIEEAYLYYLYYRLLLRNIVEEPTFGSLKSDEELCKTLFSRKVLHENQDLSLIVGFFFLFFKFSLEDENLSLPDYMYPVLKQQPTLHYLLISKIIKRYGLKLKNMPKGYAEILVLDLLNLRNEPFGLEHTFELRLSHVKNFILSLGLDDLSDPSVARKLFEIFMPYFRALSDTEDFYKKCSITERNDPKFYSPIFELGSVGFAYRFSAFYQQMHKHSPLFKAIFGTYLTFNLGTNFQISEIYVPKFSEHVKDELTQVLKQHAAMIALYTKVSVLRPDLIEIFKAEKSAYQGKLRSELLSFRHQSFIDLSSKLCFEEVPLSLRYPLLDLIAKKVNLTAVPLLCGAFSIVSTYGLKLDFVQDNVTEGLNQQEKASLELKLLALQIALSGVFFSLKKNPPAKEDIKKALALDLQEVANEKLKHYLNQVLEALIFHAQDLIDNFLIKLATLKAAYAAKRDNQSLFNQALGFFKQILLNLNVSPEEELTFEDKFFKAILGHHAFDNYNSAQLMKDRARELLKQDPRDRSFEDELFLERNFEIQHLSTKLKPEANQPLAVKVNQALTLFKLEFLDPEDRLSQEGFMRFKQDEKIKFATVENNLLQYIQFKLGYMENPYEISNTQVFKDFLIKLKQLIAAYTKPYQFDFNKINLKIKESQEVQEVIGEIREQAQGDELKVEAQAESKSQIKPLNQEENEPVESKSSATSEKDSPLSKLSPSCLELLQALMAQGVDTMDLAEFDGLCLTNKFMSGLVAVEMINDWCYEIFDEGLLDYVPSEHVVYIYTDLLEKIEKKEF